MRSRSLVQGTLVRVDPQSGNLAVTFPYNICAGKMSPYLRTRKDLRLTTLRGFALSTAAMTITETYLSRGTGNHGAPAMAELANGSDSFAAISLPLSLQGFAGQVQWDGKELTLEVLGSKKGVILQRLTISGSTATVIGTTKFKGVTRSAQQSWIQGGIVFVPYGTRGRGQVREQGWSLEISERRHTSREVSAL